MFRLLFGVAATLLNKITFTLREYGFSTLLHRGARYLFRRLTGRGGANEVCASVQLPTPTELQEMVSEYKMMQSRPKISILLPVYETEKSMLIEVLDSVAAQVYEDWELCVTDDASKTPHVRILLEEFRSRFPGKVKLYFREENGHISMSSNDALQLATGELLALLDHDDLLTPHALFEVAKAAQKHPSAVFFYSNEDKINSLGQRFDPTYKSAWSPEQFRSFMYVGHLSVYRTEAVQRAGGFRAGFEGAQDFDLALRVLREGDEIVHIPEVLYHWRTHPGSVAMNIHAKPYAFKAGKKAVLEAAVRDGFKDVEVLMPRPGIYDTVVNTTDRLVKISSIYDLHSDLPAEWAYISDGVTDCSQELLRRCFSKRVAIVTPVIEQSGKIYAAGLGITSGAPARRFAGSDSSDDGYGARLITPSNVAAVGPWGVLVRVSALKYLPKDFAAGLTPFEAAIWLSSWLRKSGWRLVCNGFVRAELIGPSDSDSLSPKARKAISALDPLFFEIDPFYPPGLSTNPANFQRAA